MLGFFPGVNQLGHKVAHFHLVLILLLNKSKKLSEMEYSFSECTPSDSA
jgi:hypothetical protein